MTDALAAGTIGVVLAGGLSRRMKGEEKSLLHLAGKPLIRHVCERLQAQLPQVIINANGDPDRFSFLALPVQGDIIDGFAGPLAGIVSAMHWAKNHAPQATRIITAAADTPFFPENLVLQFEAVTDPMTSQHQKKTICMAYTDGNRHPVFGSWPIELYDDLKTFLVDENERKVMLFAQRHDLRKINFEMSDCDGVLFDPFFNINTPHDLAEAEKLMKSIRV